MKKKHSYENIQLQALAEKKKKAAAAEAVMTGSNTSACIPDEHFKSCANDEQHTYMNVKSNATTSTTPVDHTQNTEWDGVIPPPPPPAIHQKRDSGSSPHSQVTATTPTSSTPSLPPKTDGKKMEKAESPTPPIPERHYSDADIRMSPPPPLPQRQYSGGEDTLSPPPLPERHYTAADLGDLKHAAGSVAQGQGQGQMQNGPHLGGLEARDRSKSLDSDHNSSAKYEISEMGHQYALVTKGKVVDSSKDANAPPPLPKRFRERFNEDSPFPVTSSNENISQAGVKNSCYVDIDHSSEAASKNTPFTDTIAYAVVKVDGSSDSPPSDRRPIRRVKTPRPYEDALSSGSGTPPPPALTETTRPKRPPAYEEIDTDNSEQMDGKMATVKMFAHKIVLLQ